MSNELTNQSGIIKIEVIKDGKVATTSMYIDHYLKHTKIINSGIGDSMIQSVLSELDIHYVLPTNETINNDNKTK
jgi:hypothetical protein